MKKYKLDKILLKKTKRQITTRIHFLFKNSDVPVPLADRLKMLTYLNMWRCEPAREWLKSHLHYDSEGRPFYMLDGYKIYFNPHYEIVNQDQFAWGITQVIMETFVFPRLFYGAVRPKRGDVVVDLGANIGTTAMLFSKYVGENGHVYAVEPVTHETIKTNIAANGLQNISVIPKGVSNCAGTAEISLSDFCLDSSIVNRKSNGAIKTIELSTLDTLFINDDIKRVDFIKMDIEGAEEPAIRGGSEVIKKFRPKWSISSYHTDFENVRQHNKLVKLLLDLGYSLKEEDNSHIYAW